MSNKNNHIINSEGKLVGIPSISQGNQKDMKISQIPLILKKAIEDWQGELRVKMNDEYLDGLEELSQLTGISRSTLRDYITTTEHSMKFPPLNKMIQICIIINNPKPLKYSYEYLTRILGEKDE